MLTSKPFCLILLQLHEKHESHVNQGETRILLHNLYLDFTGGPDAHAHREIISL